MMASVEAIGRISSRWSEYLRRRGKHLAVAKALVYGGVVFFVLVSAMVAYVASEHDLAYFVTHRDDFVPYFGASIVIGLGTVMASYFVLNRRTVAKVGELSGLVEELKGAKGGHEEAWRALAATKKMLDVLPEIARPKSQDALVYALVAFALSTAVATAPIGIIVGLVVFLYFRHEAVRTYETELSRLEEQRKIFEQKMQSFAQSL